MNLSKDEIIAWARESDLPSSGIKDELMRFAHLARANLVAENQRLRGALEATLHTLVLANEHGVITDTIWHSPYETLFDYISAALETKRGEA